MIEVLAYFSMLLDHVGVVFFPDSIFLRILGRLSFPCFLFMLVRGYQYSRDRINYLNRLGLLALFSQIPFYFMVRAFELNICITLMMVFLCIELVERKKILYAALVIILADIIKADYGSYGVLLGVLFYVLRGKYVELFLSSSFVTLVYVSLSGALLQMFFIPSLLFLLLLNNARSIRLPRVLKYSFYPVHIVFLLLVKFTLSF